MYKFGRDVLAAGCLTWAAVVGCKALNSTQAMQIRNECSDRATTALEGCGGFSCSLSEMQAKYNAEYERCIQEKEVAISGLQ